jgi:hypothetical protein
MGDKLKRLATLPVGTRRCRPSPGIAAPMRSDAAFDGTL